MKISAKSTHRRSRRGIPAALLVIAAALGLIIGVDYLMRPAIESIIAYRTQIFATQLIHDAILEQLGREDISYDAIVLVTRGDDGKITSIQSDMAAINKLKATVGKSIVEKLKQSENNEITIPVGTLIGNQFTSGRGPDVSVKVIPTGYVQTEITNRFNSAGINQTQHQIMLRVGVSMAAVLPGYSVKTDTETGFCIAETVIVGEIPQGYAAIGGIAAATFAPVAE